MTGLAQGVEKVYVSTDRDVYVSGDEIWCSLFTMDAFTGKLSPYSAVSYVELVGVDGTVAVAKIGLMEGRGAGKFRIPVTVPTGNYRLLAYTAQYQEAYMPGSKLVSVFNTTSTARVSKGVKVVPEKDYKSEARSMVSTGLLNISTRETPRSGRPFSLAVSAPGEAVDVSFSVYELDELNAPSKRSWANFFQELAEPVSASAKIPEYEGEIVYASVEGLEGRQLDSLSQMAVATLSCAGSPTDVYVGKVGNRGRLLFFTDNIYGDRELVCEVAGGSGYISLMDPFLYPSVEDLEELVGSPKGGRGCDLAGGYPGAVPAPSAGYPAGECSQTYLPSGRLYPLCFFQGSDCGNSERTTHPHGPWKASAATDCGRCHRRPENGQGQYSGNDGRGGNLRLASSGRDGRHAFGRCGHL